MSRYNDPFHDLSQMPPKELLVPTQLRAEFFLYARLSVYCLSCFKTSKNRLNCTSRGVIVNVLLYNICCPLVVGMCVQMEVKTQDTRDTAAFVNVSPMPVDDSACNYYLLIKTVSYKD